MKQYKMESELVDAVTRTVVQYSYSLTRLQGSRVEKREGDGE